VSSVLVGISLGLLVAIPLACAYLIAELGSEWQ
jgi:hypothetical protein